jgi:hypothetical protein
MGATVPDTLCFFYDRSPLVSTLWYSSPMQLNPATWQQLCLHVQYVQLSSWNGYALIFKIFIPAISIAILWSLLGSLNRPIPCPYGTYSVWID